MSKILLIYVNTKHPNIRFTFELEDRNSFSFLDMKIIRNTEKKAFEISVCTKSTFSGVFTILLISKVLFLWHIKWDC